MAPSVRLRAAGLAALGLAGVALLLAATTPAGGDTSRGQDAGNDQVEVTQTYRPADPGTPVTARGAESDRFTTLIIPSLKLRVPVVRGTGDASLARGVGVWDNDTLPGEKGNYALAGHRVTHGEPFADLPQLQPGDRVIIETASYRFVYVMDTAGDQYSVDDADLWPVDPMPEPMRGGPNRILTLITCAETFHSPDRFVAFGHLRSVRLRH